MAYFTKLLPKHYNLKDYPFAKCEAAWCTECKHIYFEK